VLYPEAGRIEGAIEDDMHHFRIRFDHADGVIIGVEASAVRHPWTGCGGAAGHVVERMMGERLADIARRDPTEHCTHMSDLAVLMAAQAHESEPSTFDMQVGDKVEGRSTATLSRNGKERLRLLLDGTVTAAPEAWAGRDLKQVSKWKADLDPETAELMVMLRRAVYVSSARGYTMRPGMKGP